MISGKLGSERMLEGVGAGVERGWRDGMAGREVASRTGTAAAHAIGAHGASGGPRACRPP